MNASTRTDLIPAREAVLRILQDGDARPLHVLMADLRTEGLPVSDTELRQTVLARLIREGRVVARRSEGKRAVYALAGEGSVAS